MSDQFGSESSKIGKSERDSEFQYDPLPKTNPVLVGYRWKEYHEALGLKHIVDFSWQTVLKEKPGMIHLLDFPYNGGDSRICIMIACSDFFIIETRSEDLMKGKITDNLDHL